MKYNRVALIDACDKALIRDEKMWHERREQNLAEHSIQARAWLNKYGTEWAQAGLDIRRAIREDRPVTLEMLPRDRRYGNQTVAMFHPQYDFNRSYEPPMELLFLRRILDVVTDDIVTTSGLAQVGVSTKTMRDAAWFMAVGSAKE